MQYTVAAVQEAISLLMLVANNPNLGVTELAKRSGNTKARAYRLLTTLEECGFVQRDRGDAAYTLGYATVSLGLAAQKQVSLVKVANQHLPELGRIIDENLGVLLRDGLESVNIALWDSSHDLRPHHEIGRRRPLTAGASGKVLLAYASEELQKAVLGSELPRFTPNTIVSKSKLAKELIKVKAQGYAVSDSEAAMDVVAIAAPIFDSQGHVIASVSIAMPTSRAPKPIEKYVAPLRQTAEAISRDLGWTGQPPAP